MAVANQIEFLLPCDGTQIIEVTNQLFATDFGKIAGRHAGGIDLGTTGLQFAADAIPIIVNTQHRIKA